jgi:putative salt-induced outer membrane protein
VSLILDHNSDVADGIDNLDTQTAVTLVYSFF